VNQSLPTFSFDVVTDFRTEKLGESLGLGPISGLVEGLDGSLYGTTKLGGRSNVGVLFKVSKMAQDFRVLHNFDGASGAHPMSTPLLHSDGSFYGVTSAGGKGGGVFYRLEFCPKQTEPKKVSGTDPVRQVCCAFGYQDGLEPAPLAGHHYGTLSGPEGYVYTKAAGLVDLGHVRDNADMTKFVYDALRTGYTHLELFEGSVTIGPT
jgi:uncharacterized repeat protein (TIGR03803 family)